MPSSMSSSLHSNFGVLSASGTELHSSSASQTDSDFEVVLVTQAASNLALSDSDSGSLVSTPTDLVESSDDEHIFVSNILQSTPNTPRPPAPSFALPRLAPTPRSVVARPIIEDDHESDVSEREGDSSVGSSYDSDSDDGSIVHARARTLAITNDRIQGPISLGPRPGSTASLGTVHANGSTATLRPAVAPLARPASTRTLRRSTPAGMHTPAITTNTIVGIVASAPLSPPTPSDGGEIPYAPFTAAPTAVSVPIPVAPLAAPPQPSVATSSVTRSTSRSAPPIPSGKITKRMWAAMNTARLRLGFKPLRHVLRERHNAELDEKERREAEQSRANRQTEAGIQPRATTSSEHRSRPRATNPLVAPRPSVGGSPMSSEDERPRARASMFSPVNDMSVRSDSPDEEAYDEAIKQLDEHMSNPPEHPTAAYRYLLNRALLLEFRICTPDTLPTSHGAAIAMVKAHVHVNVLDYVAKRKEGFQGLHSVMLASAKALRKNVRKRRMPVKQVKSLGLHSLLVHN